MPLYCRLSPPLTLNTADHKKFVRPLCANVAESYET